MHTPQSTLLALLRNHEIHLTRQTKQSKSPSGDVSSKLGLAQESDDELLFLETCFQAQGIKGPQAKAKAKIKKSKEASAAETREYSKQFQEAKLAEIQSWIDNDVYDLVDLRKLSDKEKRNFVTGRWVLNIKRDRQGNFLKCKARWVLRGFQDKQKWDQQTDSPAASRPGFRMACQLAAHHNWTLTHMDIKTAFLQGDRYDDNIRAGGAGGRKLRTGI